MRTTTTRAAILAATLLATISLTGCGATTHATSALAHKAVTAAKGAASQASGTQVPDAAAAAGSPEAAPGTLAVDDKNFPIAAPGTCTIHKAADGSDLPDPKCTPGATNPNVTEATIDSTICTKGYTSSIRPPVAVTNKIKTATDLAYGLPTSEKGELDHLVSLELGGAPDDPRNLWNEPGAIPNPKDSVENKAHDLVCGHKIPLTVMQGLIAADWSTAIAKAEAYKG